MPIRGIKTASKWFQRGSVCVCGQRGRGKDLLMSNVAVRQPSHISNVCYGQGHIPLDFNKLDINNDYRSLVSGNVVEYIYPYPEGVDIYISDIGVYFPSQYTNNLNKDYPHLPAFLGLSRHLGKANCHLNTQCLNRCWVQYREQSDTYLMCLGVFKPLLRLGIVVQRVRYYELYDACVRRVPPFMLPKPSALSSKEVKQNYEIEKARYDQTNGKVRDYLLVYKNKSTYDDRYFKTLLEKCERTIEERRQEEDVDASPITFRCFLSRLFK